MRLRVLLVAALMVVAGCASTQRTLSYPATWPDADVHVGEQRFQIWFHERDQSVLIQRGNPRPLGQLLAGNYTVYAGEASPAETTWRAAADAVLADIGCSATDLSGADQVREARFACLPGTDVRAALLVNRERWRQGVMVAAPATPPPS
jgi:hypothetical protein